MADSLDIGALDDFEKASLKRFEIEGDAYVLVRDEAGEVAAFEDRCSHMDLPISAGSIRGNKIHCPWHGAYFHPRSGEALSMPAVTPLERVEVQVDGGRVLVTVPEEE